MSTPLTQRVMTASEVLTWIAFRKPEGWSRADPRMKLFVNAWRIRHPDDDAPVWLRLGHLLAEADTELLLAVSEGREPVYASEEVQVAAEANQLERDRRRNLDDAAEQLRQACAAGDLTATGRFRAGLDKPAASGHGFIPAVTFSGSDRVIKSDGRLLDTLNGRSRVLWQSLEFKTSQILLLWPVKAQPSLHDIQDTHGKEAIPATKRQRPKTADVDSWFKTRVSEFLSHSRHPTEDADQTAADEVFGARMVSRDTIRKLRDDFVKPERRPRGPSKR